MDKKLLIAGIDPGTTVGYALIDLKGNIVSICSEKHLDFDSLVSKVVKFGLVLVVGTDKAKVPSFVEKFSAALGARIISPDEDLKSSDKADLTRGLGSGDDHQMDALAAALFSLKRLKPLLKKLDDFITNYGKQAISNRLIQLVVSKGMSIRIAAELLEKPDEEESRIISKAMNERRFEEKDFLRIYTKLKNVEKENYLIRQQNRRVREEAKNVEKPKEKKLPYEKTFNKLLRQREKRFFSLEREISSKDTEIDVLKSEITKLHKFLSNLSGKVLLKKLDNLGSVEFEKKVLNISDGDVLLVDDPNMISDRVISAIKDVVHTIIFYKKPGKKVSSLPFAFIDSANLDITENEYFAIVPKEQVDRETGKADILNKVIEDYKRERSG